MGALKALKAPSECLPSEAEAVPFQLNHKGNDMTPFWATIEITGTGCFSCRFSITIYHEMTRGSAGS